MAKILVILHFVQVSWERQNKIVDFCNFFKRIGANQSECTDFNAQDRLFALEFHNYTVGASKTFKQQFNWQERTLIQLKICFFSVRLHHKRINHFCFFFCAISWIRSFNLSDDTIKVAQKDKNLWSNCSSGGAKNEIVGFSGSSHL